jgi:hypothetical protein
MNFDVGTSLQINVLFFYFSQNTLYNLFKITTSGTSKLTSINHKTINSQKNDQISNLFLTNLYCLLSS